MPLSVPSHCQLREFSLSERLIFLEFMPADLTYKSHVVAGKAARDWVRRATIEENSHP